MWTWHKRFADSCKKYFILNSLLAVSELKFTSSEDVWAGIAIIYKERIDKYDFDTDDPVSNLVVDGDKKPRKSSYNEIKKRLKKGEVSLYIISSYNCEWTNK